MISISPVWENQTPKLLQPDPTIPSFVRLIRDVPDFPKPGIVFKDITPVCADPAAFRDFVDWLVETIRPLRPDAIVGIDARGFVFGGALAYALGLGVVLVRKKGKLPADVLAEDYNLEYGASTLEMHADALRPGARVVIVDDLLATGGTIAATISLCKRLGADVIACAFLVELSFLNGRDRLGGVPVFAPVEVKSE